jgi:hypothetical protein
MEFHAEMLANQGVEEITIFSKIPPEDLEMESIRVSTSIILYSSICVIQQLPFKRYWHATESSS